jgi:hypothetical protein
MKFHFLSFIIFASCIFVSKTAKAQKVQIEEVSDSAIHRHYHYWAFTLLTGAGVSIPFHTGGGAIGLSFPYTSTDATSGVTTNNIFQSNPGTTVYNQANPFLIAFGLEAGGLKHFFSLDFDGGSSRANIFLSTGYGFIWYFNGLGEHEKSMTNKRFVFKASMNIVWTPNAIGSTSLGTIDNTNQTINLLGYTAHPTFDITTTDADGNSETDTYSAQNLNVSYSQTEWSLLPKISIGNNPYRGGKLLRKYAGNSLIQKKLKLLWNLSLGYNLPFYYKEGLKLSQDDGNGNSNNISNGLISFKTPGITFMYNGKQTTSTPFHFSGLYISLAFSLGASTFEYY